MSRRRLFTQFLGARFLKQKALKFHPRLPKMSLQNGTATES